jgi:anaerobic selenocysteine-containing dehydrogenase
VVQSNSLDALVAGLYLNQLLGTIGRPGGVLPPAPDPLAQAGQRNVPEALSKAQIVLVDGANPVYTLPASSGVAQALSKVETVISFSSFVDDTAAYADLILPDHHSLESSAAVVPAVSVNPAATVATPFVRPLYETRAFEQTLGDVVAKMGLSWEAPTAKGVFESKLAADQTWDDVVRQGGLWADAPAVEKKQPPKRDVAPLEWNDAVLSGAPEQFPFQFQPYLTVQFQDGRGANLPWMQELPDPVSSSMWGLPVEVDPKTAARLQLTTGDLVRVESPHGRIEAPVYVHPAALPGVVSMGIGEGHVHYGRYASGRGANPLSILAAAWEKSTGALVLGSTRVRLVALGKSNQLIQFSHTDRDHRPFQHEHR